MAGFEVIIYGRFWVIAEGMALSSSAQPQLNATKWNILWFCN
jgi:hypothetical protein